jgi:hypothetical protein
MVIKNEGSLMDMCVVMDVTTCISNFWLASIEAWLGKDCRTRGCRDQQKSRYVYYLHNDGTSRFSLTRFT